MNKENVNIRVSYGENTKINPEISVTRNGDGVKIKIELDINPYYGEVETPQEMVQKFKQYNDIGSNIKQCWGKNW